MASAQIICRICLKQETSERLQSLVECHFYNGKLYYSFTKLGLQFMDCTNIKLISPPDAPRAICAKCEKELNAYAAFKRTALQSDRRISEDIIANASIQSTDSVECIDSNKRMALPTHSATQTELDNHTTVLNDRGNNNEYLSYYLPGVDNGEDHTGQQINTEGRIVNIKSTNNQQVIIPIVFEDDIPQYITDMENMNNNAENARNDASKLSGGVIGANKDDSNATPTTTTTTYRYVNGTMEENNLQMQVVNSDATHFVNNIILASDDLLQNPPNGTKKQQVAFFDNRLSTPPTMLLKENNNLRQKAFITKSGRITTGLTPECEENFKDASELVEYYGNIDTTDLIENRLNPESDIRNGGGGGEDQLITNHDKDYSESLKLDDVGGILEGTAMQECVRSELFQDVEELDHNNITVSFAEMPPTEVVITNNNRVKRNQSPAITNISSAAGGVTVTNSLSASHQKTMVQWPEKPFSKVEPLPTNTAKNKPKGRRSNESIVPSTLPSHPNSVGKRRRLSGHNQMENAAKRASNMLSKVAKPPPPRPIQRSINTRRMSMETRPSFQFEYEANLSRIMEKHLTPPQPNSSGAKKRRLRNSAESSARTSTPKNISSGIPDKILINKKQQQSTPQPTPPPPSLPAPPPPPPPPPLPREATQMQPPRTNSVVQAKNNAGSQNQRMTATQQKNFNPTSTTNTLQKNLQLRSNRFDEVESLISEYSDFSDDAITSSDDEALDTRPLQTETMGSNELREEEDYVVEYLDEEGIAE